MQETGGPGVVSIWCTTACRIFELFEKRNQLAFIVTKYLSVYFTKIDLVFDGLITGVNYLRFANIEAVGRNTYVEALT